MPLEMVGEHLSINELYRLSWGAKNAHGEAWEKLKAEFDQRLVRMRKAAEQRAGWHPRVCMATGPARRMVIPC
jgi:5-methyltetrahydrofolate--homocysteine methyltransferase